jgi:type I restriction enzyme, S subunit
MAEETKSKVPKLRFKGFVGEWEEKPLGERVEFFSGLTYSPCNVQKGIGTLVLRSSNVKNGEIVDADNVYVDPRVVNSKNVEVGDIAVVVRNGSRSLIGKHAQIKTRMDDTVIGAFMTGIHSDRPAFTNALLDTLQFDKEIAKNLGATINQITTGAFRQMMFHFPNATEQTQIGGYFRELDRLIGLQQRKHDKLVTLKKAMLHAMFPQPGTTTPKIRFKGFSGDWVEKPFDQIAARATQAAAEASLPRLEYEDIISGTGELNKDLFKKASIKKGIKFEAGAVLFGKLRPYLRNWLLADFEGIAVGDFWVLKAISGVPSFLYCLIQTNAFETTANQSAGSKMPRSDWKLVSSSAFQVPPTHAEQQKIGHYFRTLDELISKQAIQLAKLKQLKSACLERMFV